jgi:hypothetical protein
MKTKIFLTLTIVFIVASLSTYASILDDPSVVGVWLLDGDLADASGNGNDGTMTEDFTWDTGQFGQAIIAAGGGAIDVQPSDSLDSVTDGLTISAWFRVDADSDTGIRRQNAYLLEDQSDSEPVPNGFSCRIWTDQGITPGFYGTTELEQGRWYHVAGTYDGENVMMYIDGEPEAEALDSGGSPWEPQWSGAVGVPGDNLQLKFGSESFTGGIDEIVLANRAFSQDEIEALTKGVIAAVNAKGKLPMTWAKIKSK